MKLGRKNIIISHDFIHPNIQEIKPCTFFSCSDKTSPISGGEGEGKLFLKEGKSFQERN